MQRHVGAEQQRVDPGEHRDRACVDTTLREPTAHDLDHRSGSGVRPVFDDLECADGLIRVRTGLDVLRDATAVVPEQGSCRGDDLRRAAVVASERVKRRTREQRGEVDQETRVGARVLVDHLVVVAYPEDVESRQ